MGLFELSTNFGTGLDANRLVQSVVGHFSSSCMDLIQRFGSSQFTTAPHSGNL